MGRAMGMMDYMVGTGIEIDEYCKTPTSLAVYV